MRNKRFPKYPDDTDYTTNAPSYYEDLARKEKLIRLLAERIWGYEQILDETLEEIQERFRAWDKNLEDFPEDVNNFLQIWLNNGTLDHIINDTIFSWKLDTTIFEQFRDSVTAQLQHTRNLIKPLFVTKEGIVEALSELSGNDYDTLILEKGDYLASELSTIPSNTEIIFSRGAKIIPDGELEIIRIMGAPPASYVPITQDSLKGSDTVKISDNTSFSVGDWIHIRSSSILSGINNYENRKAELRKIEKVASDGTIVLNEGFYYDFTVSENAEIGVATVKENIKLVNVNIGEYGYKQTFFRGIHLQWAANIEIESPVIVGSRVVGGGDQQARDGISVTNCYGVRISNAKMNNIGWYGVAYGGCTQHLLIENGHFEKCRHATSALYVDGDYGYGEPHNIRISACDNYNSSLSGFDTHDTGKDIIYTNCTSFGAGDSGFHIRNDGNTKLIECSATHSVFDGVKIHSGVVKQIGHVTISGGTFSHNKRHGIASQASRCDIINKPIITDNADSGIRTMGGLIEAGLMTRNGGPNGAIRYGVIDIPFSMNYVRIKNTHFIKENQNTVVLSSVPNSSDVFKKLQMEGNIYEGYDSTKFVVFSSNADVSSVAPLSNKNYYTTDFGLYSGTVQLVSGKATVNSSIIISGEPTSYRGVFPKIKLFVAADANANTGSHFISDVGTGFFTVSSTNPLDTSTVFWELSY